MGLFSSNTAQMPRSKTEEERQANIRLGSDHSSVYNNPCLKEERLVLKCLTEETDKRRCGIFIQNAKTCKGFWLRVTKDRRAQGMTPYLPWPEEREAVRKEYATKWNIYQKSNTEDNDPE